jgi:HD-GYP domain-containing protein (c-di-GMP phosphodiesterase class II)
MGSNTKLVNDIKEDIESNSQENVFTQVTQNQPNLESQSSEFIKYMRKSEDHIKKLERIIDVGLLLSEERSYASLLEKITDSGLKLAECEAISVYRIKGDYLEFITSRNKEAVNPKENHNSNTEEIKSSKLVGNIIPIDENTIAGYCAKHGNVISIKDVYEIERDKPYHFNPTFDKMYDFRTQSMLVIPMNDLKGNTLGVVQFINFKQQNKVQPFPEAITTFLKALVNQAGLVLRNLRYSKDLKNSRAETVKSFVIASEYHDKDTGGHIERMSEYSKTLYSLLGRSEDECEQIQFASMLHDIGKISTPDSILKKPGALSEKEWAIMKSHSQAGHDMLEGAECEYLKMGAKIALAHHERWDGSGYPSGLKGEAIPLEARVVALADVFDALCSKRCYKEAWPVEKVVSMIKGAAGSHFDPKLVDLFVSNIDDFLKIRAKYSSLEAYQVKEHGEERIKKAS